MNLFFIFLHLKWYPQQQEIPTWISQWNPIYPPAFFSHSFTSTSPMLPLIISFQAFFPLCVIHNLVCGIIFQSQTFEANEKKKIGRNRRCAIYPNMRYNKGLLYIHTQLKAKYHKIHSFNKYIFNHKFCFINEVKYESQLYFIKFLVLNMFVWSIDYMLETMVAGIFLLPDQLNFSWIEF